MRKAFCLVLAFFSLTIINAQTIATVKSPDGKIAVSVTLSSGLLNYSVAIQNETLLKPSSLGIIREDADLSKDLVLLSSTPVQKVTDSYKMIYAKKRNITYQANKKVLHLHNAKNDLLDVIFQVSNDGVAFRYYFPEKSASVKYVKQEISSFQFDTADRAWLQPARAYRCDPLADARCVPLSVAPPVPGCRAQPGGINQDRSTAPWWGSDTERPRAWLRRGLGAHAARVRQRM